MTLLQRAVEKIMKRMSVVGDVRGGRGAGEADRGRKLEFIRKKVRINQPAENLLPAAVIIQTEYSTTTNLGSAGSRFRF